MYSVSNIFDVVIRRKIPHESHYSDLYIPVTDETKEIVKHYSGRDGVTVFRSQIDNELWFDLPFAYEPFFTGKPS